MCVCVFGAHAIAMLNVQCMHCGLEHPWCVCLRHYSFKSARYTYVD